MYGTGHAQEGIRIKAFIPGICAYPTGTQTVCTNKCNSYLNNIHPAGDINNSCVHLLPFCDLVFMCTGLNIYFSLGKVHGSIPGNWH